MTAQSHRLTITELSAREESAVLRVSGELDHHAEPFFLSTLGTSVAAGRVHLVLDVTALAFCDSRGLNCLLAIRWLLARRGGLLVLSGVGRRLAELLAQTGSTDLLPARRTVAQALADLPEAHRPAWPPHRDGTGAPDTRAPVGEG
ncbi:STAS domain-containing protein [Streptomyces sp. B-S-A8]|uniref:Anti-sigma factor antagonist n=1 Tax=Streptomyces solicavernae TaxID=3043614 RepID=A0ABT6RXC2_9ACTN|nr:STAS domain-containing protein [Streptomyces sp. B-S-A8]MDI3389050.1 STAS domain-containing protein [Streptomyces sp. B-S-A8]